MTEHNSLLGHHLPPAFDGFDSAQVVPTIRALIETQDRALAALETSCAPHWDRLVVPLSDLAEPLGYAWGLVHHLLGVRNEDALRAAQEEVEGEVVAASLRLAQSRPLYRAFRALRDGLDWPALDGVQRRIVQTAIDAAEQAGVGLEGAARDRFLAIETSLAEAGTKFSNNVLDATRSFSLILRDPAEVAGLPASLLAAAAQSARMAAGEDSALAAATPENGPWRLTLDAPMVLPFLEHSTRRDLRERLYRAHITRASERNSDGTANLTTNNLPYVEQILRLRREKALLLGYPHYAALSLSRKMAKQVPAVEALLDGLRTAARPHAERELAELQAFARAESGDPKLALALWDVAFWAERLRERRFSYTEEELRPYLPLPAVCKGLFTVAERLFGVRIEPADGETSTWHTDVRHFRVRDESGAPIATFFLDPYSRPENKRGGAWMGTCLDRKRLSDGTIRLPAAYLICNQTPPVDGKPSLMTFNEVETLFHEFGHGLQHMLTRVDHVDAAGINNIEWDAVELPSQFMENWCYHRETLLGFARHHETGVPLPEALFEKILAARTYRAGSQFMRQIYFATLDLELHAHFDLDAGRETVAQLQHRVAATNTVLAPLPEDRMLAGFSHIFAGGYAAGYYSYKWAEVLAADAFAAFEEAGLSNAQRLAEVGRRFRDTVLARGGGQDPGEVFRDFRGRDPDPRSLLRSYGLAA